MHLAVRAVPRAAVNAVTGWEGDELVVRVTVAPDRGQANAAVCRTVAEALGVPKSAVTVVRGATSRHKLLEVAALGEQEGLRRLTGLCGPSDAEGEGSSA